MSLQQAKILLEKINALQKSMSLDGDGIAGIERDLMLSYIRQLYEVFLQLDASATGPSTYSKKAESSRVPPTPAPVEPGPVNSRANAEPEPRRPAPEPRYEPEPEQERPRPEPRYEAPRPTQPEPPRYEQPAYSREEARSEPTLDLSHNRPASTQRPSDPAPAAPPVQPQRTAPNARIEALFQHQQARELSDRLGEMRIDDLTKAMAINDRLLYANDLFGRNTQMMNESLEQLNRYRGFDEARQFLYSLAERFDWTDEEKADTARSFIKLVRRRYS